MPALTAAFIAACISESFELGLHLAHVIDLSKAHHIRLVLGDEVLEEVALVGQVGVLHFGDHPRPDQEAVGVSRR